VKRTRDRPLAARRLSEQEALLLFAALSLLAAGLVFMLNATAQLLAVAGGALALTYPFMKRMFPLPQFYLGAAFGIAVPMAFAAQLGEVPRLGWVMFLATVLWVACTTRNMRWSTARTTCASASSPPRSCSATPIARSWV
jgi:4-hydroxybenzoate polyprenyltransferase